MAPETKDAILTIVGRFFRTLSVLGTLALIVWFGFLPLSSWLLHYNHPILGALRDHIVQHLAEYLGTAGLLFVAYVCTMPAKCPIIVGEIDTPRKQLLQQLWTWFRDGLQTAVPAARNHSNPTPPAEPAKK